MDALDLARSIAGPAQRLGMSFYFDADTRATAHERCLNSVDFYGVERAGVLGDVGAERVLEVFAFFSPGAIEAIWTAPAARCDPVATARAYIEAAYDFADRTFGALDAATLGFVGQGARRVAEGAAPGEAPLAEGYLARADPVDPVHQGYLGAVLLRELRARRARAEDATDHRLAELLEVLDGSFDAFAQGVEGMLAALAEPVAVER